MLFLSVFNRTKCWSISDNTWKSILFWGIIVNVSSTALDGIWYMVNNKETTCKRPEASFWFYIDSSSQAARCQCNTWGFICLIYPVIKRGRDHTSGMKLLASKPFEIWTHKNADTVYDMAVILECKFHITNPPELSCKSLLKMLFLVVLFSALYFVDGPWALYVISSSQSITRFDKCSAVPYCWRLER